jgi:hypothetical protein
LICGKIYGSIGEEERRYAIFRDTLRRVDQHNAAGEAGINVPRIGLNGFTDMTTEEWNVMCCGARPEALLLPSTGGRKERGGRRSTRGTYVSTPHLLFDMLKPSILCIGSERK